MKKQKKQSKIINFLGVVIGIIFLLVALTSAPTSDPSSALIPGVLFGMLIIFFSLTSIGEISLKKWYLIPLFPFPSLLAYIAPNKGFWILLIYGILACGVFVGLIVFAPDLVQDWLRTK